MEPPSLASLFESGRTSAPARAPYHAQSSEIGQPSRNRRLIGDPRERGKGSAPRPIPAPHDSRPGSGQEHGIGIIETAHAVVGPPPHPPAARVPPSPPPRGAERAGVRWGEPQTYGAKQSPPSTGAMPEGDCRGA